jgi:Domain of unknown function (DUF4326)
MPDRSASDRCQSASKSVAPADGGNPFVIGRDGLRDEVIAKYRAWIVRQPALMAALHELRSKDLVCWCCARALPRRRAHRTREPLNPASD